VTRANSTPPKPRRARLSACSGTWLEPNVRLDPIAAHPADRCDRQGKYREAESVLREYLVICQKKLPESWRTFELRGFLGGVLLEQREYAQAEQLLIAGYEGLAQRTDRLPWEAQPRVEEALERPVRFYRATANLAKTDEWNQKLNAFAGASPGSGLAPRQQ
jgi:hypothetical protein